MLAHVWNDTAKSSHVLTFIFMWFFLLIPVVLLLSIHVVLLCFYFFRFCCCCCYCYCCCYCCSCVVNGNIFQKVTQTHRNISARSSLSTLMRFVDNFLCSLYICCSAEVFFALFFYLLSISLSFSALRFFFAKIHFFRKILFWLSATTISTHTHTENMILSLYIYLDVFVIFCFCSSCQLVFVWNKK